MTIAKDRTHGRDAHGCLSAESEAGALDHDHAEDELEREVYNGMFMTKAAIWAAAALTLATIVMSGTGN